MLFEDSFVFFLCPFAFNNTWVQVVEPALAALFRASVWKDGGDSWPASWSILCDKVYDELIFFAREGAFLDVGIEAFFPSSGYLRRSSVWQVRCNETPLFPVSVDKFAENFVLPFSPVAPHNELTEKVEMVGEMEARRKKRRVDVEDDAPDFGKLELHERIEGVLEAFHSKDCGQLAQQVRELRLFLSQTNVQADELAEISFDPKQFIVSIAPAIVSRTTASLVIEMLALFNTMLDMWKISDAFVLMRDGVIPEARLIELLAKNNDEITQEIITLLSLMYNGDDAVSRHIFNVLPLSLIEKLIHDNGNLYSPCAVYLSSISKHGVPEDIRVSFALLCGELIRDFNIDANVHGLFALSNLFTGHSATAQRIVDVMSELPIRLKKLLEISDELPKWGFHLMSQMALSCCNTPGYKLEWALAGLQHPHVDVQSAALLAVHHMLLNRGSQTSPSGIISDDRLYECVIGLLSFSLSSPFCLRIQLAVFIPEIVDEEMPEHYYRRLVNDDLFAHLSYLCEGETALDSEISAGVAKLLTKVFRRAQAEGWESECREAFEKGMDEAVVEALTMANPVLQDLTSQS